MSFAGWLISLAVFVIILFTAFGIGLWYRNSKNPRPQITAEGQPYVQFWGNPTASADRDKNFCQTYTFPTVLTNVNGVPTAITPNPTLNLDTLNRLEGRALPIVCLDTDQIRAQQIQHTCLGQTGAPFSVCRKLDGEYVNVGENEIYYSDSYNSNIPRSCTRVRECAGKLSLVALGYNFELNCLQVNRSGLTGFTGATGATGVGFPYYPVDMAVCDPSKSDQLFRVTRIDPGQNPASLVPGGAQNGLIGQILDRETGYCLRPGPGSSTTNFFRQLIPDCNVDASVTGPELVFAPCQNNIGVTGIAFQGYQWLLLPSVSYCSNPGGCTGCSGCFGCVPSPNSSLCTGCVGCTGFGNIVTPPQLVYLGNLDFRNAPLLNPKITQYKGLTGTNALILWAQDNGAKSIYYGGTFPNSGLKPVIGPIGINYNYCPQATYAAQYINLDLFNTISRQKVCLASDTTGASCVAL